MEARPKLKLELTTTDKTIEVIGWIAVLSLWAMTLLNYSNLPAIIPTHYNSAGHVDGYGAKDTLLILPFIASILFIALTVLTKFPQKFNYLTTITEENANRQYTNATRMMRYLKLIVVVIFGLIVYMTIENVKGQASGLGKWFMPLTSALLFIPTIYFVFKSLKKK